MTEKTTSSSMAFILGIMPRSGTNFLANLLALHPDCKKSVMSEDFLLKEAGHLLDYGESFKKTWDTAAHPAGFPGYTKFLMQNIGEGLIKFLQETTEKAYKETSIPSSVPIGKKLLITKTPQVKNVEAFFRLFPDEKLIIIVRDGRPLVESMVRSFNVNASVATKKWIFAAQTIVKFEKSGQNGKYLRIRYEDLHSNNEAVMRRILNYLELDTEKYDFAAALNLPVFGSSEFKRDDKIHWHPVKKTGEFKPLERAKNWSRVQHERFNWLAKNELIYFGYEPKVFPNNKIAWKSWNRMLDFRERVKIGLGILIGRIVGR